MNGFHIAMVQLIFGPYIIRVSNHDKLSVRCEGLDHVWPVADKVLRCEPVTRMRLNHFRVHRHRTGQHQIAENRMRQCRSDLQRIVVDDLQADFFFGN
ncbi:hypothetical protein D3C73_1047520 [compost metagenome]